MKVGVIGLPNKLYYRRWWPRFLRPGLPLSLVTWNNKAISHEYFLFHNPPCLQHHIPSKRTNCALVLGTCRNASNSPDYLTLYARTKDDAASDSATKRRKLGPSASFQGSQGGDSSFADVLQRIKDEAGDGNSEFYSSWRKQTLSMGAYVVAEGGSDSWARPYLAPLNEKTDKIGMFLSALILVEVNHLKYSNKSMSRNHKKVVGQQDWGCLVWQRYVPKCIQYIIKLSRYFFRLVIAYWLI